MTSWGSPNNAGDELSSSPYSSNGWPTPRTGLSTQSSPRGREHALQPPPLTTSLGGHRFQGLGVALGPGHVSTPLSTTSLSSPFTQSPAVNSPAGAPLGSSPMISRQYNVPYNPQDWGPVHHSSMNGGQPAYPQANNMLRVVTHHRSAGPHSDMNLSPPPPPYSPPSQPQQTDQGSQNASSMESATPNSGSPYTGTTRSSIEGPDYQQHTLPRTRGLPTNRNEAGHNRQVSLPPPPPLPQGIPASRSSSHNRIDVYRDQPSFTAGSRSSYLTVSQDTFQSPQPNNFHYSNGTIQRDDSLPPASRRAVSAGPVVSSASSSRATSQSRGQSPQASAWEPGMPLPPPPPGPPPAPRSQSANGLGDLSSRGSLSSSRATRTRQPPPLGTGLGSIPPTPAGWVDEGPSDTSQRRDRTPLNLDTSSPVISRDANGSGSNETAQTSRNSVNSGLFRSPAVRDSSAKGIRERRIERRNRQSQVFDDYSAVSTNTNPWADALEQVKPTNLVLDNQNGASSSQNESSSSGFTPQTTKSMGSDSQRTASRSRASSGALFSSRSSYSTPRVELSPQAPPTQGYAQTPPFSPDTDKESTFPRGSSHQTLVPPKALPTPPLQSAQGSQPPSNLSSRGERERPVSHILHLPNESVTNPPLQPRRVLDHQRPSLDSVVHQDAELIQSATRRHRDFIEKEASAVDETEALKLFAEFIIAESKIRRERYTKVWDSGSFDLEQIRKRLFELPPKPTPAPQAPPPGAPPLASLSRAFRGAPKLDIPQGRSESAYKPCLSPIQSLNMSNDEMSSRGRAPSRWWESKTGSGSEGGERRVQRSKRESKYMGLPLEALGIDNPFDQDAQYATYGPDEYPPEKVGWHEEPTQPTQSDYGLPIGINRHGSSREMRKMDVSRLITLPPPYPRHYPAVNNSHPELVSYRTLVRSITDLSEIKTTRQRHLSDTDSLVQDHKERIQEARRQFKSNIQSQIQAGGISFAEAAEAEAALIEDENRQEREMTKKVLDAYQETVMKPMQVILKDRIDRATLCIDELRSKLFDDAQHETPDQTQEEGDEKPELLEKLTQLKWLFEAREQLHREVHDITSDRDDRYKAVVVLPYKQKNNDEKVLETTDFFVRDALDRRVTYESQALARLESFLDVIEENVVRGVEMQLSAFWDIAPSLLTLVQQLPENLNGFQVQIPANEYEENPSYHQHPLQYLYTLVSHAEKSSYQYIESQINLFCLLHEVKSAVMKTNYKLLEAERTRRGELEDDVKREIQESRVNEERTLTNDLKDRVGTVEGQWTEALGSQIQGLRERVKEQLEHENGWEDLEQLEQT